MAKTRAFDGRWGFEYETKLSNGPQLLRDSDGEPKIQRVRLYADRLCEDMNARGMRMSVVDLDAR